MNASPRDPARRSDRRPGNPSADEDIRPGFIALLVCVMAATLVPVGIWTFRSKAAPAPAKTAATSQTAIATTRSATRGTVARRVTAVKQSPAAAPAETPVAGRPATSATAAPVPAAAWVEPAPTSDFEGRWGIRLVSAGLARKGAAVDVHYLVTAPSKIARLADAGETASLVDRASGTTIPLCAPLQEQWPFPPHSRARSMALTSFGAGAFPPPPNRLRAGKTYSILVPNPDGNLKSGSVVALAVGESRSDDLTVE